ncbi:aminoacyl-tRNA hydrolase [Thermocrispum municipale]|uniref:aminoacyl-tRNA hydrolase n=1 Tax=Thermocrispum municipale TaxID=37926 RepID=UPI0004183A99|nr:aminoacyl-tRNA hydrolase [Thermocrispum municipale]
MSTPTDVPGAGELVLLAGLGNPGPRYETTRHNIGFLVLDELADRVGGSFKAHRTNVALLEGRLAGVRVAMIKPRSYMNLSGGPVKAAAQYFGVEPSGIVAVHDELDLDFGVVRLKFGGGESGHNGLRSLTSALGTRNYYRVRFGIGRPPGRMNPADYVLKDFSTVERKELAFHIDRCADAVEALVTKGLAAAQNTYH